MPLMINPAGLVQKSKGYNQISNRHQQKPGTLGPSCSSLFRKTKLQDVVGVDKWVPIVLALMAAIAVNNS